MKSVSLQEQYLPHFDGYIEIIQEYASLLGILQLLCLQQQKKIITPELFWYLGHHPNAKWYLGHHPNADRLMGKGDTAPTISWAKVIKHLLDKDSHQAQTQTAPGDFPTAPSGANLETKS